MENSDLLTNDLQVSPVSQRFLDEAAKWGKFLSIIGFIFCGILALASFFAPMLYSKATAFKELDPSVASTMSTTIVIIYLAIAVLLFFPCLYLNKFSAKMRTAIASQSQENFEESFQNLKSLFKFYGILTVVMLSFYILVFAVAMLGVAMR